MRATTPSSMAANPPRTYGISRLLLYDELHALHPQDTHSGVRLYDLPVGAARRPGLTVYIDGKTWTARSADGEVIEPDAAVRILRMEGVKLIVQKEQ